MALVIRRKGDTVSVRVKGITRVTASGAKGNAGNGVILAMPTGFKSNTYTSFGAATVNGSYNGQLSTGSVPGSISVTTAAGGTWTAGEAIWGEGTYLTPEAWPSSLPGVAGS